MNKRLRQLRKSLGMSQVDFGERIGVKQSTIAGYESGARIPLDSVIFSICREFNVNIEWLQSGEGDMFLPFENESAEMASRLLDESNPFYDLIIDIMQTFDKLDDKGKQVICDFAADLVERNAKRKKED